MGTVVPNFDINIVARDFDITDPLRRRVEAKVGSVLEKLGQDAISANVVLRMHKLPAHEQHTHTTKKDSQIAEVTLVFRGGAVIHASERSEDMYATVDLLSHKLAKSLRRHHNKVVDKRRDRNAAAAGKGGAAAAAAVELEEMRAALADFDDDTLLQDLAPKFRDNIKPFKSTSSVGVVRPKYFPMPPISVEEAVHQLDLIDHPFYVFRNQESNEINVVYRRNHGGVGHIMPGK